MKKHNNIINQFATYFDQELQTTLPISILPDKSLLYKNFLVKQNDQLSWELYNLNSKDLVNDYYSKSCALVAAKAYYHRHYNQYYEINDLDRMYQLWYNQTLFFKHSIDQTTDYDRYEVLLTRLEESNAKSEYFRNMILRLFRHSFI